MMLQHLLVHNRVLLLNIWQQQSLNQKRKNQMVEFANHLKLLSRVENQLRSRFHLWLTYRWQDHPGNLTS